MINNEKMIELLERKLNEGYDIIEKLNVGDKEFEMSILNMFQIQSTIKGLKNEDEKVRELNEFDSSNEVVVLKSNEEIEAALSKNEAIEI